MHHASLYHTHFLCVTADSSFSSRDSRILVELPAVTITIRFRSVAGEGLPSEFRYVSLLINRLFIVRRSSVSQDVNITLRVLSSIVFTAKNTQISVFMNIRAVGTDGRTDRRTERKA